MELTTEIKQPQDKKYYEYHSSEIRYVIYKNTINSTGNPHWRDLHVLLDRESLTEQGLKKLFWYIDRRFPDPNWLNVWVSTSLWQVYTPEESEMPSISGLGDDPHADLYPSAFLMRLEGNKIIRYTPEGPPYRKMKTVVISGVDPYDKKSAK